MKKTYTVILLLILSSFGSAFGQVNLDQLYAQRRSLAQEGKDYLETEREILSVGIYPSALVSTASSDEGRSFEFKTYKLISEDKQDRIEQRLIASIGGVQSVEINNQQVSVIFKPEATEENVLLLFKILGYTGYEIKN